MSKLHFIKAPCHQSTRQQGYQIAPNEIKEKYDFEILLKLFDQSVIDLINDKIDLCKGYQLLYKYILEYSRNNPSDKIITIGGDHSISTGTIPAMNEKYMKQAGNHVSSDLMVLWIDSFPDLDDFVSSETNNLSDMAAASLFGFCGSRFTDTKLLLNSSQLIYFGLADNCDLNQVQECSIPYFTCNKIKMLGAATTAKIIKEIIGTNPLHVTIDMKVFDSSVVKSVDPVNNCGLNPEHITTLLSELKDSIVSMDIAEFNPCIGTKNDVKICKDIIRNILLCTFDIKQQRINLFTEDTKFLIFRSVEQEDPETDIGWYILRGLSVTERNKMIEMIPDDKIINLEIDGKDYLITTTTMNIQNKKSYYSAKIINNVVLFPQEKEHMAFELLV